MRISHMVLNMLTGLGILLWVYGTADAQMVQQGTITQVRDGDTIEIAGVPIRLWGVYAPEHNEPRGLVASRVMMALVGQHHVQCQLIGKDSEDRAIGRCWIGDNPLLITQPRNAPGPPDDLYNLYDLGGILILLGFARDCPRYSHGYYANLEQPWVREEMPLPGYCEVG
jgi:endonuclease YncB( thermonuclease family)